MKAASRRMFGLFPKHIVFWVIAPGLLLSFAGGYTAYRLTNNLVLAESSRSVEAVSHALDEKIREQTTSVLALRADWMSGNAATVSEFQDFAEFLYESTPGVQALQRVDAANIVRDVYPAVGENKRAINFDNTPYPDQMQAITQAKETNHPVATEPFNLVQGFPGILLYAPMFRGTEYVGQSVGVIRLSELLDGPRSAVDLAQYVVTIRTPSTLIVLNPSKRYPETGDAFTLIKDVPETPLTGQAVERTVQVADKVWRVRVVPRSDQVNEAFVNASSVFLIGGIFVLSIALLVEELQRVERERERALAGQTEIISLLAHQLRTPIAQSNWILEGLAEAKDDAARLEMLNDLRAVNANNKRLLDNLLSLSRIQRGILTVEPREVRLSEVVNEALSALTASAAERRITLDVDLKDTLIWADPIKAPEAVRNIVDNAIKYSPDGTHVRIDLDPSERKGEVTLRIADQGAGIPETVRPIIFEQSTLARQKTHENSGAGLGLYLTKKFLTMMDGDVRFKTSEHGTTFYVTFKKLG